MITLFEALEPRKTVFERSQADTVWNLSDIEAIKATDFFAENYITAAMRILLPEAFKRLEQRDGACGIFRLSQSMGGGKTHSLLALGLLAKHQSLRAGVLADCGYELGPLGGVRLITFSGGAQPTPNGLWGFLAEQIGKKEALRDCYSPLRAPTEIEWERLLGGEPTLILLDELPPYFEAVRAITTGATSLDALTTIALRNLFQSVKDNKLPNVCIVLTDLAGTAYQGSAVALDSLKDADYEANRVATTLTPVDLSTDELYCILRKRLFARLPSGEEVAQVAEGHAQALDQAQKMGLITDVSPDVRQRFINAYPFHPAIRDLYARVKENASFQQTRALIRIVRLMVQRLWETGQAKSHCLVCAQDFDLLDQSMKSEIAQINSSFEAAVAKDVQDSNGNATAQRIDADGGTDAQDAARLLFLSSLSTAVNPTVGLHRTEIAEYLAEPGRDMARLKQAIDILQERANYLHPMAGSKLVFRNTENLVAKVEEYVRNTTADMREQELRKRLTDLFRPGDGDVYQEVYALTPFDQISLEPDKVKLVIHKPTPDSMEAAQEFFDQQLYKNRVCLLTADSEPYRTTLEKAAYLAAIERVMSEPAFSGLSPNDPQRKQADDLSTQYQSRFYQALSTSFTKLFYPWSKASGLFETEVSGVVVQESSGPGATRYVCKGEAAIKQALIDMGKYVDEQKPEALLPRLERIWPEGSKTIEWSELRRLAATTPGYAWHHPRALDYLRDEMVKRDQWRLNDKWVERGPFARLPARVEVERVSVNNETGRAVIRVRPLPSDGIVHHSTNGAATPESPKLEEFQFETGDLWHSFLCIDPSESHPGGEAVTWTLQPIVRYAFPTIGGRRLVRLEALPAGSVRYTADGSSVETSGVVYAEPFEAPPGALVQARAEGSGVKGEVLSFRVPAKDKAFVIDATKPAVWKRQHACDSTNETYAFLELAKAHGARLGGLVRLTASREQRTVELNTFEGAFSPEHYINSVDTLRAFVMEAVLTLIVGELHFDSGADLEAFANERPLAIGEGEVEQQG